MLLDAVDAYTAAYRDQVVLDLALNNEERLKRQLEATRDRFEVGEVARTDVAQAEARLSRARADVEQAKADLASSRAFYERVVGEAPSKLEEPKVLQALPKTESETRAIAEQNPDIIAATFDLYAARDNVDVQFSSLLPSLDLQGVVEYADQPTANTEWGRTAALGLNLSVPLYQGGGEYSRVRESRQRVRQQRDHPRERPSQRAGAGDRLLGAAAGRDRRDRRASRPRCAPTKSHSKASSRRRWLGARTVLDVLDAEQELFTSQVNLVRARPRGGPGQLPAEAGHRPADGRGPGAADRALRRRGLLRAQPDPAVRRRRLTNPGSGATGARRVRSSAGLTTSG